MNHDAIINHFSKQISQLYDIVIHLTERVDRIEKHLCAECNEADNDSKQ
jgi:hypothetical protein